MSDKKPNYSNWVPKKILFIFVMIMSIGVLILVLSFIISNIDITIKIILFVIGLILTIFGFYYFNLFYYAYKQFSREGGDISWKIYDFIIEKLDWDGNGKLLDIGCGSGAVSIECAKRWPNGKILGIDYWGKGWDYNKKQCEENAKIENVYNTEFKKGDASNLNFYEEFDAVISNFVFHEVKNVNDKKLLVGKAIKTLKKGGKFSFHDLFYQEKYYGSEEDLIRYLDNLDLEEYKIERTDGLDFLPEKLKHPFFIKGIGIIYGKR